jgi:hypothetical protein
MMVRRMSTRRESAAINPRSSSHGGRNTHPISAPMNMLVLIRSPMMIPEPMLRNETPKPKPTRAENALTINGIESRTHCRTVARNVMPESATDVIIT